jgi:hypothetical protein
MFDIVSNIDAAEVFSAKEGPAGLHPGENYTASADFFLISAGRDEIQRSPGSGVYSAEENVSL